MKNLNDIKNELDCIPAINWGGCGLSALAMYRWLKDNDKLVGDEFFVFLYVDYDHNFETNDKILSKPRSRKKWGQHHISCYTIMVNHMIVVVVQLNQDMLKDIIMFLKNV